MKRSANSVTYMLRIMVGFYLLYIDYSLLKNWQQLNNKIVFLIFIALFGVVGLLLIIYSLLRLMREKNEQKNPEQDLDPEKDTDPEKDDTQE